ncbi:NAD(P)H-binding protein [Chitinophaga sp. Mgbs1]|uniref:NAD(P)H-binding protein n=1 Tax=Chitinophaga solisilvae TaxID=1233460 RepID=A0A3S1JA91_9BACT|nr:NAD(P)H-binding protein [Chitinophaga solisilvae]
MKITVTGSLGNISKPLTQLLVQQGHHVTVISSQPERQKDIEALHAHAAIGTLEDADFLRNALQSADALYAMVPPSFTAADQRSWYQETGRRYAAAITATGVRRVVFLSSMGAHLDAGIGIILGARDVESIFNDIPGISVTHLRPGYFYYNLYGFMDTIRKLGHIRASYGEQDMIELIAPADIAAVAAEELEATPAATPAIRYIVSDERTCNEVAAAIGKAIGQPDLQWRRCSREQTLADCLEKGIPENVAVNPVDIFANIHSGDFAADYRKHQPIPLGKIKLEDFAQEFAAAFRHGN